MTDPRPATESGTKAAAAMRPDQVVADLDEIQSSSLVGKLSYGLSLPERTARSVSAVVGGLVNETAGWLIPAAFRSSKTYSAFVQQALDMMIHDVGGVANPNAATDVDEEGQLARKAVGGLLDLAGAATLHLSPITVLAVFNDVAYGSSHYLKRLSEELKREGIIDESSSIDHVSDLIDALEKTGGCASDAANAPPMSVDAMTETITQITNEIKNVDPRRLIPQSEIKRMWNEMENAAGKADVGIWDVSATMTLFAIDRLSLSTRGALSTVRVAGSLVDEHFFSHYSDALTAIGERGFYQTLSDSSGPYLEAAWHNFDSTRETWTEDLITGRMPKRFWSQFVDWFKRRGEPTEESQEGSN